MRIDATGGRRIGRAQNSDAGPLRANDVEFAERTKNLLAEAGRLKAGLKTNLQF